MTDPPIDDTEAWEPDAPGTHDAKQRAPVHGHTGAVPSRQGTLRQYTSVVDFVFPALASTVGLRPPAAGEVVARRSSPAASSHDGPSGATAANDG
eukprot:scaffold946_cov115-Isochrysis_galbana.AAC.2